MVWSKASIGRKRTERRCAWRGLMRWSLVFRLLNLGCCGVGLRAGGFVRSAFRLRLLCFDGLGLAVECFAMLTQSTTP